MEALTFNEKGFGTDGHRVAWDNVRSIGIRTTPDGPYAEDVFWMFELDDGLIELPGSAIGSEELRVMQTILGGFNDERVIMAMGSTDSRVFRVWHGNAAKLAWNESERRTRFEALVQRLGGATSKTPETFAKLNNAWTEPTRRYHNREHLAECLDLFDELKTHAADADVVELALWFHDAVYTFGAGDNESRSAELLLREASQLGIVPSGAEEAAKLVHWTAHHGQEIEQPKGDAALLLDIDLSILGSAAIRFLEYEYSIEEEHPHVHPLLFRIKRGRFLASMLMRDPLFHTELGRTRFETRARANLRGLLKSPRYQAFRIARFCFRWPKVELTVSSC